MGSKSIAYIPFEPYITLIVAIIFPITVCYLTIVVRDYVMYEIIFYKFLLAQNCTAPPSPRSNMVVLNENNEILEDVEHAHETTVM